MTDDITAPAELGGLLVTYRMAIYLGGVALIGLPLAIHSIAGVTVPASVRLAITVTTVGLMTATYFAERRSEVGFDDDQTGGDVDSHPSEQGYSLRTRVAVASAVLGLAAGVYVGLEVSPVTGLLFVAGAYLFAYLAYRGDGGSR